MTLARKEITPPITEAMSTVTTTARMLFHSALVIRNVVARAASAASKMTTILWQPSERPIAVSPCLSLAPLSATICKSTKTIARKTRIRTVKMAEMVAGDLLDMLSPYRFMEYYLPWECGHLLAEPDDCFHLQKEYREPWVAAPIAQRGLSSAANWHLPYREALSMNQYSGTSFAEREASL